MREWEVEVNMRAWRLKASSARVAINKVLRSCIGTRTADKYANEGRLTIRVEPIKRIRRENEMTAKELLDWIKKNAYKFEPHEPAQSNGEMLVLTEALLKKAEELATKS